MEIGPLIKLHRIKQNMTQEDLAAGIVSESYLSKIENQKTDASPEVIALLCERLGIQLNAENEDMIKEKAEEWYGMLYEVHNAEERRQRFQELETLFKANNSDHEMLFEIQKIRFFLVEGRVQEAKEQIDRLETLENTFEPVHLFYWNKFLGNYNHTVTEEFSKAITYYEYAESIMESIELQDKEVADIHYLLAVLHSKLVNDLNALEYGQKALSVFRENYNFVRCAQCHIVLGIAYRRLHMHDMAIKQYNLAKHLGEITDENDIIQLTNHNLGYLHSRAGQSEEAIKYYKAAFDMDNMQMSFNLTTVTSLIREYYITGKFNEAQCLINQAKEIMVKQNLGSKVIRWEIEIFQAALDDNFEHLENIITNQLLPHLVEQEDNINVIIYSNMIAKKYEEIKKYKNASIFYKMANKYYQDLLNL